MIRSAAGRVISAVVAGSLFTFAAPLVPEARGQAAAPPSAASATPEAQTPAKPPADKPPAPPAGQTPPPGKPGARGKPQTPPAKPKGPAETRVRLVVNGGAALGGPSYSDVRTPTEYAERSNIRTSYETGTGVAFGGALQVSLYRGLGLLAGYSRVSRDVTGTIDVSRPHPLHLNRPRTASRELEGFSYSEGAIDFDVAYGQSRGSLDWALFAGFTMFQVEADLVDVPTYDERYPYDELVILSAPARTFDESTMGFNVGGRLDYRFGATKRFGVGIQLRYAGASVTLNAGQDATDAEIDAGGLAVGGGIRVYF